jgi:predicted Rossmann-fold nucleotide-binding protein
MQDQKIRVGRLDEKPVDFTFEDIKKGAVRDSGLFPELYASKWPEVTAAVLVTGVERKYKEHIAAVEGGNWALPLYLPPVLFPRALEDSKESEKNQAAIAKGKLDKSFIAPFRYQLQKLTGVERSIFVDDVKRRAGVNHLENIVAISDDRNSVIDDAFRHILYGDLYDHWNEQVREIFSEKHLLPGKRVKETDSAHYGILNSVFLRQKADEFLKAQGVEFNPYQRMDTTLCIAPLIPGFLPLPEQGLIVTAIGVPFGSLPVTQEHFEAARKGRIFTHDDFNLVFPEDRPEGVALGELKKNEPNHPFFSEVFSPGRALNAFAHMAGIPQRKAGEPLWREFHRAVQHKPQTVVSNIPMLAAPPRREDIEESLNLPSHMRLTKKRGGAQRLFFEKQYGGFRSLRELEEILHSGQAFVIQDPDKFDIPQDHGLVHRSGRKVTDDEIRLLRRLETDLIFAYLTTMTTQPGSANHFGRSHLVEKSYWEKYGQWHPDFCNLGLAGDIESEAYRIFETEDELREGLEAWDRMVYKHYVPLPANDFMRTEEQLLDTMGIKDAGYVVSSYGSASSYIDLAYKDAEAFNYELARLGVTTNDGGGARSAMLGARMGNIRALQEGFNVLNIGIRSETDVSPLEGNIKDSIRSTGFEPITDAKDKRHIHYADGQFHILKLNRLLQRQAAIAAMSDVATYFAGGNGTVVEVAITRLHNAKVRILGEGLFPGFESDNRTIPMVFINHEFEHLGQKRGIFDVLNKPFKGMERFFDMQDMRGDNRIEKAVEYVKRHAAMHGYKLRGNDFKLGLDGVEPLALAQI